MRRERFEHRFVEFVPEFVEEGVLYISIEYATAVHKCYCGCGSEVATPLSPVFWKLIFDGDTVSLYPSIGNWSFPCRSHYWIDRNAVRVAAQWSQSRIDAARERDRRDRARHLAGDIQPYAVLFRDEEEEP